MDWLPGRNFLLVSDPEQIRKAGRTPARGLGSCNSAGREGAYRLLALEIKYMINLDPTPSRKGS